MSGGLPWFQTDALKELNRNQPIIIACDRGGAVENLVDEKKAREPTKFNVQKVIYCFLIRILKVEINVFKSLKFTVMFAVEIH